MSPAAPQPDMLKLTRYRNGRIQPANEIHWPAIRSADMSQDRLATDSLGEKNQRYIARADVFQEGHLLKDPNLPPIHFPLHI